ncbi:substrate-binding domain-containing protein [Luteolibacter sp. LG18]|uniref:substrate-binding domain-containing protein n=1 Tax=Luteolibacter sp. LG18 TaxID=2819286 RepID=UPI002B299A0E|nr:sugar ABC transporter substrate-binding protein [Luteolibacter sp. LG18]
MMNTKSLIACAIVAAGCLTFTGCTKKAATGEGGKRKVLIGFIGKSLTNDVFQAAQTGAKDAAREYSASHDVEVEIEIRTPNDEDATKQAEAIEALVRQGAQGIAISCSEANTVQPAIDKAVAKGVAVMCFDSDAPGSKRFAYYGTDDKSCGERTVDELAKAMGGKGTIAILGGNQSAPNLQNRVAGAKAALAKYPEMKLNEPGVFYHVETPEKAAEAVQSAQNANPGIQGWVFIGGWPLFTADALKWPAGSIKVASVDALPAQLGYLKSGHVEVLLAQDCYGWGTKSVGILLDKVLDNKSPADARVVDPLTKVTKENVDGFGKNWEKWLAK